MASSRKTSVNVMLIKQGNPSCAIISISDAFIPSLQPIEFHRGDDRDKNWNSHLANNIQRMLAEELLGLRDDKTGQSELVRKVQFMNDGIHIFSSGGHAIADMEQKIQKVIEKCFAGGEVVFTAENAIPV